MFENKQRIWAILIIILGGFAGAIFLSPFLNLQFSPNSNQTSAFHEIAKFLHIKVEILAGFIIGMVFCFVILPLIFRDHEAEEAFQFMEIGIWGYFSHPTNVPLNIGAIWMLVCMGIFILFNQTEKIRWNADFTLLVIIIPVMFLFGLSGFRMIKRNETVNKFGTLYKGFWAYLNGIVLVLFGWGGLIYLLLAWIFKW